MERMQRHIIGIDEAGRGPLAGPVAVCAVMVSPDFDWHLIDGVNDSKQLSEGKREGLFARAQELKRAGVINYRVSLVGAGVIDRVGIQKAVALGIDRTLSGLACVPERTRVKLDGSLRAPDAYVRQETIVRGDQKEQVIGLASIIAKVRRDRHVTRRALRHPEYGFEIHKGYGTVAHRAAIKAYGLCSFHRSSFCTRIVPYN